MFYIVQKQSPRFHELTLDDILSGEKDVSHPFYRYDKTGTITRAVDRVSISEKQLAMLISVLRSFNERHKDLIEEPDRKKLYDEFYIPKKSGGLRRIDAPCEKLKDAQRELKGIFTNDGGFEAKYHTAAFAYVSGRSTVDSIKKHQSNQSRWFLKTDFSDFFGSTTKDFVLRMLAMIYPFCCVMEDEAGRKELETAIDLCFLNGGLPQGTPISPMLTNLIMIPIDHAIAKEMWSKGYCYTRYADDSLFSHPYEFDKDKVLAFVDQVLREFGAPFSIKPQKTRYGSSSGSNWNLGIMLNRENKMTIGYKNKDRLMAMCHNFICNTRDGILWDIHDVQVMSGLISYYNMIEPDVIDRIIIHINKKHHANLMAMIKNALNGTEAS